jgi:hypothetical protein
MAKSVLDLTVAAMNVALVTYRVSSVSPTCIVMQHVLLRDVYQVPVVDGLAVAGTIGWSRGAKAAVARLNAEAAREVSS